MLFTRNLSYSINGKKILSDISCEISKGEFVGLLGPNGSGKTTFIKILSGVYRDYLGTANLNLIPLHQMKPSGLAQFIAVVPQEAHFAFAFTALEIVLMGRSPYQKNFSFDSPEDYQVAKLAMKKTDCWQFANRNIQTLSGGEKQRVLLARALAQKPRFLLLDEPANHLDLKHQGVLLDLLQALNHELKLTILCVMHDVNMALHLWDRLLCLKEGRLILEGRAPEVMTAENLEMIFDTSFEEGTTPSGRKLFLISQGNRNA